MRGEEPKCVRAALSPPQFVALKRGLRRVLVLAGVMLAASAATDRHAVTQLDLACDLQGFLDTAPAILGAQSGKVTRKTAGVPLPNGDDVIGQAVGIAHVKLGQACPASWSRQNEPQGLMQMRYFGRPEPL